MKKVLTIDGGGVRGIVPAMILAEIERRMGKPAHKLFDVIAGTSTGAFIGALATRSSDTISPASADEIVELYRKEAGQYFKKRFLWQLSPPKYQRKSAENVLRKHLGEADLARTATRFIAPVYALREQPPRVHYFNTLAAQQLASDNHLLWQVVRGATAAPSYFQPFDVQTANGSAHTTVIDGGVYANNPAMLGWLHAHQSVSGTYLAARNGNQHHYVPFDEQFTTDATSLKDTVVVSLGTGFSNQPIDPDRAKKWGRVGWLFPLLDVIVEAQADQSTAELNIAESVQLLAFFRRLQPALSAKIKLGDVRKLPDLELAASKFIASRQGNNLIKDVCAHL